MTRRGEERCDAPTGQPIKVIQEGRDDDAVTFYVMQVAVSGTLHLINL